MKMSRFITILSIVTEWTRRGEFKSRPSGVRRTLDVQFTLVLWPKGSEKEACLLVLGPDDWQALVQKIKGMPYSDPTAQALRRILGTKSDRVMLDKAGRICVPEWMAKAVIIEKEAVLVGLLDRFEIWNPERYATTSAVDEQLLPEAMKLI